MPFRYLIKKPKQGEIMDNAQELKAHLQDGNKARMYEEKKKKQLQKKEIEQYGDVNQGLGTWNGYEYVKNNGGQ